MKNILYILLFFLILSCEKNDDNNIPVTVDPDPNAGVEVQNFMWRAMNYWYFWQADVPNLADDKFPNTTEGSKAYTEFLLSENGPEKFFNNKLRFTEDRFSFLSDDYVKLTQALSGISKSNGLEFGLARIEESDAIFGYVRYIIEGSDAATKDIARGDVFTGVNGQALDVNNFFDLLFGPNSDTYTLNMATVVDGNITDSDKEVSLTKQEGLAENPILLDKIFEIQGQKIGYLVYNGFTNEYDDQLNEVFGRFKAGGVTELVLDLRYNPGGSVRTTVYLSSMIHGTNTNDVFLKAKYNGKYQAILEKRNEETRRFFADKIGGNAINTLNLSKVYVLATNGSASASELVINGLEPYMDVVHIGETTRGKNEFSVTMVDDRESNWGAYVYNPERKDQIKQGNNWAIQPLIGRNENADGVYDYTSGLVPDIKLKEDLGNLGVLGDLNEPLLAKALEQITGATGKRDFTVRMPIDLLTSSKMFSPLKDNMYVDQLPFVE